MTKVVPVVSAKSTEKVAEPTLFLRAVSTQSGDGLAIEVADNANFSGARRVVKVGTIGQNGQLALKRYPASHAGIHVSSTGKIKDISRQ